MLKHLRISRSFRKAVRWISLAVGILVLLFLAEVTWVLGKALQTMKAEDVTASVVAKTQDFVERTGGKWPRTWQDIETGDCSDSTQMNFDLDPLTATREQVFQAIRPRKGTYHHGSKERLGEIYEALCKYHKQGVPDSAASDKTVEQ